MDRLINRQIDRKMGRQIDRQMGGQKNTIKVGKYVDRWINI